MLFIECNRPQLKHFSAQLAEVLPLRVTPLLIEEFKSKMQQMPGFLQGYALVVTTFFHVHEVQILLADIAIEVAGLLAEERHRDPEADYSVARGHQGRHSLPWWAGTENLRLSIQNAGLTHIQLIPGCGQDPETLRRMLNEVSVVVCSSLVASRDPDHGFLRGDGDPWWRTAGSIRPDRDAHSSSSQHFRPETVVGANLRPPLSEEKPPEAVYMPHQKASVRAWKRATGQKIRDIHYDRRTPYAQRQNDTI